MSVYAVAVQLAASSATMALAQNLLCRDDCGTKAYYVSPEVTWEWILDKPAVHFLL